MKYKIEILPLADHFVVAAKDRVTGEVKETFVLNESGVDMLRLFCKGNNVEAVLQKMAKMYHVSSDLLKKDVMAFADRLKKKGIM